MAKRQRMWIHEHEGITVLSLGCIEIWDGADMALLRETLTRVIEREGRRSIAIDMSAVKYIPSGFFGMLYDWHEKGVAVRLTKPQPNVAAMLWFRQFFEPEGEGWFRLLSEPKYPLTTVLPGDWESAEVGEFQENSSRVAAAPRR